MADAFPLPRSGLKLLRLILIGYLHEGGNERKAVGPTAVGAAVGLDPTVVSRNNAFLAAVSLIESAESRRWRLTSAGVETARAFEYDAQDELRGSLNDVLRANDFVQRVVAFIRSRGGIEEEQVVAHMARLAGARRASDFLTGARALLELMSLGGLIEADGQLVRAVSAPTRSASSEAEAERTVVVSSSARRARGSRVPPGAPAGDGEAGAVIRIDLQITAKDLATDAAVDKLAARIQRLIQKLSTI